MSVNLTRPVNWAAWIAAGTVIAPLRADKPVNWPGLALLCLTLAAGAVWLGWV